MKTITYKFKVNTSSRLWCELEDMSHLLRFCIYLHVHKRYKRLRRSSKQLTLSRRQDILCASMIVYDIEFVLQDVVDDHRNFREYTTHRLEQILCAENAYARVKSERSTRFDGEVHTFQLFVQLFVERNFTLQRLRTLKIKFSRNSVAYLTDFALSALALVNSTLSFLVRCRPELEDLSSEDEAVATDLDMHALILSSSTDTHSPEEPLKTAEEVLREIDDIMQV